MFPVFNYSLTGLVVPNNSSPYALYWFVVQELQKTVMEKLKRETWMRRWLEAQKSIDLQIDILQRLLKLLKGDDGLLTLLRHLHDSDILPVENRLPIEGITLGENLPSELCAARKAQENFVASVTGDLEVLGEIAQQLDDLASVVFSSTDWLANEDVIAKLSEAGHLCLYLTSLRVHRLQQEMAQKLSIFSS
ncbi:unnamed protein product [Mesocestoides corti]|uniref:PhoU domain-containing protein n=1 Tax=Mesocestoides corti TaxID=53468 RepID=A0A0R3U146_MESCO|nr:unnamed protein product [Mesocestoides corti]